MSYYDGGARYNDLYNQTLQECRNRYVDIRNREDIRQYNINPATAPKYMDKDVPLGRDMKNILDGIGVPTAGRTYNQLIKLMINNKNDPTVNRFIYTHKMGYLKRGQQEPRPYGPGRPRAVGPGVPLPPLPGDLRAPAPYRVAPNRDAVQLQLAQMPRIARPPAQLAPRPAFRRPVLSKRGDGTYGPELTKSREDFVRDYISRNPETTEFVIDQEGIKPRAKYYRRRGAYPEEGYRRDELAHLRGLDPGYTGRGKLNRGVNPYKKSKRGRPL